MNAQDLTDAAEDNLALFLMRYRGWFAAWAEEQNRRWLAGRHAKFGKPRRMKRGSKPAPGLVDFEEVEG